jgi:CheY-like chemotaxis protein
MKVLIVEDHPDMRDLLGRIVERMGYVPALASKGEEGVEKAIAEKPKLNPARHDDAQNGWSGSGTKTSGKH